MTRMRGQRRQKGDMPVGDSRTDPQELVPLKPQSGWYATIIL